MQRCGESIAALATTPAKAQPELTNPEKSRIGTVRLNGGSERGFRYAPWRAVSRSCAKPWVGEIVVVQITQVEPASGAVSLTTMHTHASGEWIASDWPVCALADLTSQRRMGAALTYARRYALFTLVGIAGEDDLVASDLDRAAGEGPAAGPVSPAMTMPSAASQRHNGKSPARAQCLTLDPAASMSLREQLLAKCVGQASLDDAVAWAQRTLKAKNTLRPEDAQLVEEAFHRATGSFGTESADGSECVSAGNSDGNVDVADDPSKRRNPISAPAETVPVDKSALAISAPRRRRDKAHLRFVMTQACLVCGRSPSDPYTCVSPRSAGWASRRATSSSSRCAAPITMRFIARSRRPRGGPDSKSIRSRPHSGFGAIPGRGASAERFVPTGHMIPSPNSVADVPMQSPLP